MPTTIRKGDRGPDVERWQNILVSLGFDPNGVDGIFGNGTARATREFQRAHDLVQDAIVGPKTWGAAAVATAGPQSIRRGDRGPDVVKWQRLLTDKGFDTRGVDGIFGPGTEQATRNFQAANGLLADGVVSSITWSTALKADVVAAPVAPVPPPSPSRLLKDRIDVGGIALPPPQPIAGRDAGVIRVWNRYGGVLSALSDELGIDRDAAGAVLAIESGGTATTELGPVIRFENHIFWDRWGNAHQAVFHTHFTFDSTKRWQGHRWRGSAGDDFEVCHQDQQPGEWKVFRFACGLDEAAAITSTSIGLAQIMGFHHRRIGYATPREMLDAFATEGAQIIGFFDFVATSSGDRLLTAIRDKDWATFAKGYNGTGKFQQYADKMLDAFEQLRSTPH